MLPLAELACVVCYKGGQRDCVWSLEIANEGSIGWT